MPETRQLTSYVLGSALVAWINYGAYAQSHGIAEIDAVKKINGSTVAIIGDRYTSIYFSHDGLIRWQCYHFPTGTTVHSLAGGNDNTILVLTLASKELSGRDSDPKFDLCAITTEGKMKVLSSKVSGYCEFYDDKVGCQMKNGKLSITNDSGGTWHETSETLDDVSPGISWLSSTALIVATADNAVALVEINGSSVAERWRVPMSAVQFLGYDKENVWVRSDQLQVRSLRDGQLKLSIPIPNTVRGIFGGSGHLYMSTFIGRPVLASGYHHDVAAMPRSEEGWLLEGFHWDGTSLKPDRSWHEAENFESLVEAGDATFGFFRNGKISVMGESGDLPVITEIRFLNGSEFEDGGAAPASLPATPATYPADWWPTRQDTYDEMSASAGLNLTADQVNGMLTGMGDLSPRMKCRLLTKKFKQLATTRSSH